MKAFNELLDTLGGIVVYFCLMTFSPKIVFQMVKTIEQQKRRKERKMRYMKFSKRLARESENVL